MSRPVGLRKGGVLRPDWLKMAEARLSVADRHGTREVRAWRRPVGVTSTGVYANQGRAFLLTRIYRRLTGISAYLNLQFEEALRFHMFLFSA